MAFEHMPQLLQFLAELEEVVDLSIESDCVTTTSREHRLPTRVRKIDDREPAMTESDEAIIAEPAALSVRPAVLKNVGHSLYD
jgi:hypothetical protein